MSETSPATWHKLHESMLMGLTQALEQVEPEKIRMLVENLVKCKRSGGRVFFAASARSRNIMRTFACRLAMSPIAMLVHDLCGSTFPPVKEDDLLIVCSSTGYTQHVIDFVTNWKGISENVVLITSNNDEKDERNVLWSMIKEKVFLKGISDDYKKIRLKKKELNEYSVEEDLSETFTEGSVDDHFLFEIGSLSLFEAVIHELVSTQVLGKEPSADIAKDTSSCLE